jgi:hypothetical protein
MVARGTVEGCYDAIGHGDSHEMSNVPGYRRAPDSPRAWRHVRARPRTPGG